MDYGFTADMERNLDEIASGNLVWRNLLEKFSEEFEQAKEQAEDLMERNKPIDTQVICDCGNNKKMQLRTCLLYTSPSPRDQEASRMPSSA